MTAAAMATPPIDLTLNGQPVQARTGETLLQLADRLGVPVPRMCAADGLRPDGNCRACVVEVAGERTLAASCCRTATPGLNVTTDSPRAQKSQRLVMQMLGVDPAQPTAKMLQAQPEALDASHPAMVVNRDACIQCTRCVRACREEQGNDVLGMVGRGHDVHIAFDLDDAMGTSSCVACGECVQACPTGAISARSVVDWLASAGTVAPANAASAVSPSSVTPVAAPALREVDTVCPFCGVGCQLTVQVAAQPAVATISVGALRERIVAVRGADGPANHHRLCVKGRFGLDYVHHPERLTTPLVRREGVAKDPAVLDGLRQRLKTQPDAWREVFREATWDDALDLAANGLKHLRSAHGPAALVGFGSAKGSNEEAYLFQKLVRTAFGSNNVDHCTRLCHASSVAALLEGVGSGAVSNPVADVAEADVIVVIGSNPTANHPVAATWMKNAARRGARIVLADPRRTDLSRHAWRTLGFTPGSDVALLNALLHTVFDEGLVNEAFVRERADDVQALRESVQAFSPEAMAPICGIPAERLREVARAYATSKASMILWGMGVSQHTHGTDNVRCLIALATVTGQIGRPGTGLHPLRGQNNVQGASDAGLIPMMFPNYQRVTDLQAHAWFERFWGVPLDKEPGLTVVEVMDQALAPDADPRKVRGLYVMGENPAMSDPNLNHARHALASLSHLVVQDIFLTETAWLADVVLPASAWLEKEGSVSNTDRTVQRGRQVLPPPGDARADLWIIQRLAERLGRPDGSPLGWAYEHAQPDGSAPLYHGVANVYEEMRQAMHGAIAGITWERLSREGAVTYPCLSADDPGQPVVFHDHFPTANGKVQLKPTTLRLADETPDADYPWVLITGRQLEHWHTGSMTRRATVLDAIEPAPTVLVNPADLRRLGLQAGGALQVSTRRGSVTLTARADAGTPEGAVFIPFAYAEAAANLLTNAALDPFGKIPEFKYCAARVEGVVDAMDTGV